MVLCDWATIKNNIGIDSIVLKREVNIAMRADFALISGSTATMPKARFWFGQMMNQTLKAITKAIHIPLNLKEQFYDKVKVVAVSNSDEGKEIPLTRQQLIDICVELNGRPKKKGESIFVETNFGKLFLN